MTQPKFLENNILLDKRYRIKELIKSGGMGAVYKAIDIERDDRICAIKEMLEHFKNPSDRVTAVDCFLKEIQVLEDFEHPNIPKITDHFMQDNSFYFVMDFIEGRDLSTYLSENGNPGLAPDDISRWAIQLCDALSYIHNLKPSIIHRDIKPSNLILRSSDLRILIIDFGIARILDPAKGYWMGTPGYAAPEQKRGYYEPASDVYALGITMLELLSGISPEETGFADFLNLEKNYDYEFLSIIKKAIEVNIKDRFRDAMALRESLENYVGCKVESEHNSEDYNFYIGCKNFKAQFIDKHLKHIMEQYRNECSPQWIPKNFDYFVITLLHTTPFKLIVNVNEDNKNIEFFEKQGILDRVLLGSVDPFNDCEKNKIPEIIKEFIFHYENHKNSQWQISI